MGSGGGDALARLRALEQALPDAMAPAQQALSQAEARAAAPGEARGRGDSDDSLEGNGELSSEEDDGFAPTAHPGAEVRAVDEAAAQQRVAGARAPLEGFDVDDEDTIGFHPSVMGGGDDDSGSSSQPSPPPPPSGRQPLEGFDVDDDEAAFHPGAHPHERAPGGAGRAAVDGAEYERARGGDSRHLFGGGRPAGSRRVIVDDVEVDEDDVMARLAEMEVRGTTSDSELSELMDVTDSSSGDEVAVVGGAHVGGGAGGGATSATREGLTRRRRPTRATPGAGAGSGSSRRARHVKRSDASRPVGDGSRVDRKVVKELDRGDGLDVEARLRLMSFRQKEDLEAESWVSKAKAVLFIAILLFLAYNGLQVVGRRQPVLFDLPGVAEVVEWMKSEIGTPARARAYTRAHIDAAVERGDIPDPPV